LTRNCEDYLQVHRRGTKGWQISVAYCTQTVQVLVILCVPAVDNLRGSQSATIRDNILSGVPYDGQHHRSAVRNCRLLPGFEDFR